jgi:hypothetical protein
MQTRVMVQLRSFPSGTERTAAEIARGMVGVTPAVVEATLNLMAASKPQPLATRVPVRNHPDKWRVA